MFITKQLIGEKIPPTREALIPAVKRAKFCASIWIQDDKAIPIITSPIGHGWIVEDDQLRPVTCEIPCAPSSLLELIKCSCIKNRCAPPCKCLTNNMPCTEMCSYSSLEDNIVTRFPQVMPD